MKSPTLILLFGMLFFGFIFHFNDTRNERLMISKAKYLSGATDSCSKLMNVLLFNRNLFLFNNSFISCTLNISTITVSNTITTAESNTITTTKSNYITTTKSNYITTAEFHAIPTAESNDITSTISSDISHAKSTFSVTSNEVSHGTESMMSKSITNTTNITNTIQSKTDHLKIYFIETLKYFNDTGGNCSIINGSGNCITSNNTGGNCNFSTSTMNTGGNCYDSNGNGNCDGTTSCNGTTTLTGGTQNPVQSRLLEMNMFNQNLLILYFQIIKEDFVEFRVIHQKISDFKIEQDPLKHDQQIETRSIHDYTENHKSIDLSFVKYQIPGHLGILKFRLCSNEHLYLFTRNLDSRLFRLYNSKTNESIAGPLLSNHPGLVINLVCMDSNLNGTKGSLDIITIQYRPPPPEKEDFEVILSIFSFNFKHKLWSQVVLQNLTLQGMGDNYIDSDQLDYLYFLTKPIVSLNRQVGSLCFVFMKHIYTIYQSNDTFSLFRQNVEPILDNSDFFITDIQLLCNEKQDETILLLISDEKRIILFTNNASRIKEHDEESNIPLIVLSYLSDLSKILVDALFLPGNIILQIVTLLMFPDDILSMLTMANSILDPSLTFPTENEAESKLLSFHFYSMWSDSVSKSSRIQQLDLGNTFENVAVLLDSFDIVVFDPFLVQDPQPWINFFFSFCIEKWLLISVCLVIIVLFFINELNPEGQARSQTLLLGIVYIVLLVLSFGILMD